MSLLDAVQPGARLLDKQRGRERLVRAVERLGRVVTIWFDDPATGGIEPVAHPVEEAEQRFEVLKGGAAAFKADSEILTLGHRLVERAEIR